MINGNADNDVNPDQGNKMDNLLKDLRDHYGYDQMNDEDKTRYDTAVDKVMSQYKLDTSDDETGDAAESQNGKSFDMGMENDEDAKEDEIDKPNDNAYEHETEKSEPQPDREETEYTEEDTECEHGRRM